MRKRNDGPTKREQLTRVRDRIDNLLLNARMNARTGGGHWTLATAARYTAEDLADLLARWDKVPSVLVDERRWPLLPDGGAAVAAAIEKEWERHGGAASRGHPGLDEKKAHEFLRAALNVFGREFPGALTRNEINNAMNRLLETSLEKIKRLEACGYTHFVWWLCVHEKKPEVMPLVAEAMKEPDPDNPGATRTRDMSAIADAVAMDDDRLPGSDQRDPLADLDLKDRWRDGPLEVSDKKLWETFDRLHKALLGAGLVSEKRMDRPTRKSFFTAIGEMVEFNVADTPLGYSMETLKHPRPGTDSKDGGDGRNRARRGLGLRSDDEIERVIAAVSALKAP